ITCNRLFDAARVALSQCSRSAEPHPPRKYRQRESGRCARSRSVFSEPSGNGSSPSFSTSATIHDTISGGILRRSFFVEVRHCRLKEAIALELGNKLLVRNGRLLPALSYDNQIFQVFE